MKTPGRRPVPGRLTACLVFTLLALESAAQSCPAVNAAATPDCQSGTVQLSADTGFTSYTWTPATGLSNPNSYNPVASAAGMYTVTATYAGPNLVINPDFALGNTGFISGQNFTTVYSPCNYWVGAQWFSTYFPGLQDHTPTIDNMFMMIDGCTSGPTVIWEEGTFAVVPGDDYQFSWWATEAGATQPSYEIHFIGNVTGDVIVNTLTGIPAPTNSSWIWDQYGIPLWNAGLNSSVTIRIINLQTNGYGNDFGMDDFDFHRICTSTDSVLVTLPPPPVNLGPDVSLCTNPSYTLDAGPAGSYLWSTGDTTQTIVAGTAGSYWVTVTNGSCISSDTIQLLADPPVNLGPDFSICNAASLTLSAPATGSYLWSTGATTQTITPASAGTYWVTVTYGICVSSDTIQLLADPPVNIGPDVSGCITAAVPLNAGLTGSYLWSTGATTQSIIATTAGPYWVTVTDGICVSSDTMQLTVYAAPDLGPDLSICANPAATLDAGPAGSYLWSTGATTQTITVTTAGAYWVTVTNGTCAATDTIQLIMDEQVNLGPDVSLCGVPSVTLDAGIASGYLWSTGASTQTITPDAPGQYWVTISTGNCTATDTVELSGMPGEGVLYVPNTFTPEGNGLNERFLAYAQDVVSFHMQIFDRWGELIFQTSDFSQGWDGTRKGKLVQEDTYVYVIDYKTDCGAARELRRIGHVNVIR